MFYVEDTIHIHAPIERCFLLSTSLAIVERELGMRPVGGRDSQTQCAYRISGFVTAGDRIHWRGWQLGLPQYHVSLISGFEPNRFFQDTMIAGRFKAFQHDHHFHQLPTPTGFDTVLQDTIRFSLPFGFAGRLFGRRVLLPHIRRLLHRRLHRLKRIAESEEWRKYLPPA